MRNERELPTGIGPSADLNIEGGAGASIGPDEQRPLLEILKKTEISSMLT